MPFLRTMFAIVMTLALGPGLPALASAHAGHEFAAPAAADAGHAMADCHKAPVSRHGKAGQACPCCDTQSACLGVCGCMGPCGSVLGVLVPSIYPSGVPGRIRYLLAGRVKPPTVGLQPPLTPPRS